MFFSAVSAFSAVRPRCFTQVIRVCVAVSVGVSLVGCRQDVARRLDDEAEAYVRLVLALGDRDPDSLDFYAGPPEWMAEARTERTPFSEIKRSAAALLDELTRDPEQALAGEARRIFLTGQLRAVAARVDLLSGHRFTFDEESRLLFGVEAGEVDRRAFADVDAELDRMLPGHGSLGNRYAAYERRFVIPHDRLAAVMTGAIDGCRRGAAAAAFRSTRTSTSPLTARFSSRVTRRIQDIMRSTA